MTLKALLPAGLAVLSLLPLQERVKKKERLSFEQSVVELQTAWKDKRFGSLGDAIANLQTHVFLSRSEALHAAMPPAPEGWTLQPDTTRADYEKQSGAQAAAFAMGLGLGQASTHKYTSESGGRIEIQVMGNSPLVAMFSMATKNPAMLGKDQELVRYGPHTALLKVSPSGNGAELQILIADKHSVTVQMRGEDDEFLLKLMDQAAVDRIANVLS